MKFEHKNYIHKVWMKGIYTKCEWMTFSQHKKRKWKILSKIKFWPMVPIFFTASYGKAAITSHMWQGGFTIPSQVPIRLLSTSFLFQWCHLGIKISKSINQMAFSWPCCHILIKESNHSILIGKNYFTIYTHETCEVIIPFIA